MAPAAKARTVATSRATTPARSPGPANRIAKAKKINQSRCATDAARWMQTQLKSDPVHGDPRALKKHASILGHYLQPPDHSPTHLFPTVPSRFGLERVLPESKIEVGSRGPTCRLSDGSKGVCHKPCCPAFLYKVPELAPGTFIVCSRAKKYGQPTYAWDWTVQSLQMMNGKWQHETLLHSCWTCYTKSRKDCVLSGMTVTSEIHGSGSDMDGSDDGYDTAHSNKRRSVTSNDNDADVPPLPSIKGSVVTTRKNTRSAKSSSQPVVMKRRAPLTQQGEGGDDGNIDELDEDDDASRFAPRRRASASPSHLAPKQLTLKPDSVITHRGNPQRSKSSNAGNIITTKPVSARTATPVSKGTRCAAPPTSPPAIICIGPGSSRPPIIALGQKTGPSATITEMGDDDCEGEENAHAVEGSGKEGGLGDDGENRGEDGGEADGSNGGGNDGGEEDSAERASLPIQAPSDAKTVSGSAAPIARSASLGQAGDVFRGPSAAVASHAGQRSTSDPVPNLRPGRAWMAARNRAKNTTTITEASCPSSKPADLDPASSTASLISFTPMKVHAVAEQGKDDIPPVPIVPIVFSGGRPTSADSTRSADMGVLGCEIESMLSSILSQVNTFSSTITNAVHSAQATMDRALDDVKTVRQSAEADRRAVNGERREKEAALDRLGKMDSQLVKLVARIKEAEEQSKSQESLANFYKDKLATSVSEQETVTGRAADAIAARDMAYQEAREARLAAKASADAAKQAKADLEDIERALEDAFREADEANHAVKALEQTNNNLLSRIKELEWLSRGHIDSAIALPAPPSTDYRPLALVDRHLSAAQPGSVDDHAAQQPIPPGMTSAVMLLPMIAPGPSAVKTSSVVPNDDVQPIDESECVSL